MKAGPVMRMLGRSLFMARLKYASRNAEPQALLGNAGQPYAGMMDGIASRGCAVMFQVRGGPRFTLQSREINTS
jgi:hypothetical protein